MEKRIKEEDITKFLLDWLEEKGWTILCFDFPQSGTGIAIHPNDRKTKNKGTFIPDIVAHKGDIVLFFENKDRFVMDDFTKIERLRTTEEYSNDISALLMQVNYKTILYGVGLPESESTIAHIKDNIAMVDFAILVNETGIIQVQDAQIDF